MEGRGSAYVSLGAWEFGLFSVLCLALPHDSGLSLAEKTALHTTEAKILQPGNVAAKATEAGGPVRQLVS